jgi:integrase/recombinase XerD
MSELPDTVEDFITGLSVKDTSRRKVRTTLTNYIGFIREEHGSFPTEDNPKQHAKLVNQYMNHLNQQGYTQETVSGRWTWVSRFYKEASSFLQTYSFLSENPIEILEEEGKGIQDYLPEESQASQQKRQYYVDKETLETMCENVTSPAFRNETLLRLMWTTGLRCSEICELRVDSVNSEENLLEDIWISKSSKNGSMWVPETTMWYLDQYLNGGYRDAFSYAEESDYLFLTNRAEKMHRQTPNKVVKRTAEKAGIQEIIGQTQNGGDRYKVTAHAMRRGHGMHLWKNGKSLPEIQTRLNHSNPQQTDDYLPIGVEESKEQLQGIQF